MENSIGRKKITCLKCQLCLQYSKFVFLISVFWGIGQVGSHPVGTNTEATGLVIAG